MTAAECGRDCLKLVEGGRRFNLYLLDHTFPDASGVTICEALSKLDSETPILFYPGRVMPEEREAAIKAALRTTLSNPATYSTSPGTSPSGLMKSARAAALLRSLNMAERQR